MDRERDRGKVYIAWTKEGDTCPVAMRQKEGSDAEKVGKGVKG